MKWAEDKKARHVIFYIIFYNDAVSEEYKKKGL